MFLQIFGMFVEFSVAVVKAIANHGNCDFFLLRNNCITKYQYLNISHHWCTYICGQPHPISSLICSYCIVVFQDAKIPQIL